MKKLHYVLVLFVTATMFTACKPSRSVEKAEDMGKYAFDFLKKFDQMSKEAYVNFIFMIDEIKEYGQKNADVLSENGRKEIAGLTAEDYNGRMEDDFKSIKEIGEKYNIVWNDIEYSDYGYETKEQDNIKGTQGKLHFKFDDVSYSIRVSALIVNDAYSLVRLSRLDEN